MRGSYSDSRLRSSLYPEAIGSYCRFWRKGFCLTQQLGLVWAGGSDSCQRRARKADRAVAMGQSPEVWGEMIPAFC